MKRYFSKSGILFTCKDNATRLHSQSNRATSPLFYKNSLQFSEAVRLDERLSNNERMLLADIIDLVKKKGYCYATNAYLAKLHHVSPRTITRWLRKLRELLYITIEIIKSDKKEILERRIRIVDEYEQTGITNNGILVRCSSTPPYRQNCRKNNILFPKSQNITTNLISPTAKFQSFVTDKSSLDWLNGLGFDPLA